MALNVRSQNETRLNGWMFLFRSKSNLAPTAGASSSAGTSAGAPKVSKTFSTFMSSSLLGAWEGEDWILSLFCHSTAFGFFGDGFPDDSFILNCFFFVVSLTWTNFKIVWLQQSSTSVLTPQERLKRKMQAALNKRCKLIFSYLWSGLSFSLLTWFDTFIQVKSCGRVTWPELIWLSFPYTTQTRRINALKKKNCKRLNRSGWTAKKKWGNWPCGCDASRFFAIVAGFTAFHAGLCGIWCLGNASDATPWKAIPTRLMDLRARHPVPDRVHLRRNSIHHSLSLLFHTLMSAQRWIKNDKLYLNGNAATMIRYITVQQALTSFERVHETKCQFFFMFIDFM